MVLEALNLNIRTIVALAYNGSGIAVRWRQNSTNVQLINKR